MAIALPVIIVTVVGVFCGVLLSVADKYMAVPVDERVSQVREMLPGANCGACGFAGCAGFAEAVVSGQAPLNGCPVGRKKVADELGRIMGT